MAADPRSLVKTWSNHKGTDLPAAVAAATLVALRRRSRSEVRMASTSRRISGSSISVKDSSGSRKEEGSAVSRLVLS